MELYRNASKIVAGTVLAGSLFLGCTDKNHYTGQESIGIQNERTESTDYLKYGIGGLAALIAVGGALAGFKVIRPVEQGIVERFGKYRKTADSGLTYILPFGVEKLYKVPTLEIRVDVPPQEVITKDKLNAEVDAMVYYKILDTKKALYNVQNFAATIPSIAQTTLRSVIGTMSLADANEKRSEINSRLERELDTQTVNWGIDIVRVELQKIVPPKAVQESMNKVVVAENTKIAARDLAEAAETEADGFRRASIKKSEGIAKSYTIEAVGKAESLKTLGEAAETYFKGNAQTLRQLEVVENVMRQNVKFVVPAGSNLVNVITSADITPVPIKV